MIVASVVIPRVCRRSDWHNSGRDADQMHLHRRGTAGRLSRNGTPADSGREPFPRRSSSLLFPGSSGSSPTPTRRPVIGTVFVVKAATVAAIATLPCGSRRESREWARLRICGVLGANDSEKTIKTIARRSDCAAVPPEPGAWLSRRGFGCRGDRGGAAASLPDPSHCGSFALLDSADASL
jgi:hypothetical protein